MEDKICHAVSQSYTSSWAYLHIPLVSDNSWFSINSWFPVQDIRLGLQFNAIKTTVVVYYNTSFNLIFPTTLSSSEYHKLGSWSLKVKKWSQNLTSDWLERLCSNTHTKCWKYTLLINRGASYTYKMGWR